MTAFGDGEVRTAGRRRSLTRIWRRRRYVLVVLGGVLVSIGLLEASLLPLPPGYADILVNLGASLVGVIATVLVLEPLIEGSRLPEEVIHGEFPYERFVDGVERSTYQVRILGAWPYVMDHPWRPRFLDAVQGALERGVTVSMLILDPDSSAAEQRARDLNHQFDVAQVISDVLQSLWRLRCSLPAPAAERLRVRVYSLLPPARMYRWDSHAISSFFPMGNSAGSDIKHYETNMSSRLAQFVDYQFELIWRDSETVPLDEHVQLLMDVALPDSQVLSRRTEYVKDGSAIYVAAHGLVEDLHQRGAVNPPARVQSRLNDSAMDESWVSLRVVADSDLPRIRALFHRKYGAFSPMDSSASVLELVASPAQDLAVQN